MLGENILVAPVMEPGQVSRDVYLPFGLWQDMNTKLTLEGPILLRDYPAPLDTLPWFVSNITSSSTSLVPKLLVLAIAVIAAVLFK